MKGIKWKKHVLRGRAYWEAVDSESGCSMGIPDVHESARHPGWYHVGIFDADHFETLAEAKREALRQWGAS